MKGNLLRNLEWPVKTMFELESHSFDFKCLKNLQPNLVLVKDMGFGSNPRKTLAYPVQPLDCNCEQDKEKRHNKDRKNST